MNPIYVTTINWISLNPISLLLTSKSQLYNYYPKYITLIYLLFFLLIYHVLYISYEYVKIWLGFQ